MIHAWKHDPQIKVEAGSTEIQGDSIKTVVFRPENAISRVHLSASDYEGKNFIGNLDAFTVLKVSFRYGSDSWTQVFEGKVEKVGPQIDVRKGQLLDALAYGYGRALRNTHCHVNFGRESENSSLDTPTEIWEDLVDNRINKNFDGAATGYALTKTKIKTISNPTIEFVKGGYRKNIEILNDVCRIYKGYQAGSAGVHWFVDPSKNLWIDTIAAHTVDTTNWPTWWRTDEAGSTLTEGKDFHFHNFHKNIRGFANKVLLFTDLRKPGYDYWTEDSGGASLWGNDALKSLTDCNTADIDPGALTLPGWVVGSHSLQLETNGAVQGYAYYPSGAAANWDFTKIGSEQSIPTLNFYYCKDSNISELVTWVYISTNDTARKTDYYSALFPNWHSDPDYEWIHVSMPIGPYWKTGSENRRFRWAATGSPSWSNVDTIEFVSGLAGGDGLLWIDDLHISGKIIREAYNSTSIAANVEHQKTVKLDVAVDDTMVEGTVTGTAAYLAYNELLVAQYIPVVGQITVPLAEDLLPGQLVNVEADKKADGTFRIDSNFRVQQVIHSYGLDTGPTTTMDLTDDVTNTFAKSHDNSPSSVMSSMKQALFFDPEAKSLKSSAIDELVTRLRKDYPS